MLTIKKQVASYVIKHHYYKQIKTRAFFQTRDILKIYLDLITFVLISPCLAFWSRFWAQTKHHSFGLSLGEGILFISPTIPVLHLLDAEYILGTLLTPENTMNRVRDSI